MKCVANKINNCQDEEIVTLRLDNNNYKEIFKVLITLTL